MARVFVNGWNGDARPEELDVVADVVCYLDCPVSSEHTTYMGVISRVVGMH